MFSLTLYNKLSNLPESLKKEVIEFIDSLASKKKSYHSKKERIPGLASGLIFIKDDFDEPLEDFKDYMK